MADEGAARATGQSFLAWVATIDITLLDCLQARCSREENAYPARILRPVS